MTAVDRSIQVEPSPTRGALDRAVESIGGAPRSGQIAMAEAIDQALAAGQHALIQAGTGTGKSLGYLAPVMAWLQANPTATAVVATATLALQSQLASQDIPTMLAAIGQVGPAIDWAVLKGVSNYPCLLKVRDSPVDPTDQPIFDLGRVDPVDPVDPVDATSPISQQVLALRAWAEAQAAAGALADRDGAPPHGPRAWAQVSISGRECLGPACPQVGDCFVQAARLAAGAAQLVVTNHALVAYEAAHGWAMLSPDVLVVDEAHQLADRVTTAHTDELSAQMVDRAVRLASAWLTDQTLSHVTGPAGRFADALDQADTTVVTPGDELAQAVADLRAGLRQTLTGLAQGTADPRRDQVINAVKAVYDVAERLESALRPANPSDDPAEVVWVSQRHLAGPQVAIAPLDVAQAIRATILAHQTTILTSATLKLGGSFQPLAAAVGLGGDQSDQSYSAVDVGSPFDYRRQGICYVAAHLPRPSRDGTSAEALAEIVALVDAAGGHTLGLFSSLRAAEVAAVEVRAATGRSVLLQGEGHLPDQIDRFRDQPATSLFGTLSLWQGVDLPGSTCHLVIVDRIPFPRPDEPLLAARQAAVSRAGGNGFMTVAARQAGLLLAQGAGRLIRRSSDRGVVAILDCRLLTARYGPFLMASMPPLWLTTERDTVMAALRRLADQAP